MEALELHSKQKRCGHEERIGDEVRISTWHKGLCGKCYSPLLRESLDSQAAGRPSTPKSQFHLWILINLPAATIKENPKEGYKGLNGKKGVEREAARLYLTFRAGAKLLTRHNDPAPVDSKGSWLAADTVVVNDSAELLR